MSPLAGLTSAASDVPKVSKCFCHAYSGSWVAYRFGGVEGGERGVYDEDELAPFAFACQAAENEEVLPLPDTKPLVIPRSITSCSPGLRASANCVLHSSLLGFL